MNRPGALIAQLTLATLVLGFTTPALADIPPRQRERKSKTVEPHRAPPMTPPAEPPSEPEAKIEPAPVEAKVEPAPVEAKIEANAEPAKTDVKADETASEKAETKSGSCSVGEGPERGLLGLSLLALLLSGVALTRRRD